MKQEPNARQAGMPQETCTPLLASMAAPAEGSRWRQWGRWPVTAQALVITAFFGLYEVFERLIEPSVNSWASFGLSLLVVMTFSVAALWLVRRSLRQREREIWNVAGKLRQREEIERELVASRQMLQLILDHVPLRMFWKDPDLRYLGANQNCAADAGMKSPEEMLGKTDYELAWRATADRYRADDAKVIASDEPKINFEEPMVDCQGRTRWLRTSKVPLHDSTGRVMGVLGTYEDVTERKAEEEAVRHAKAEADKANEAKSEFLAKMSHEIRTPLNGVVGMTSLLMETSLSEEQLEFVKIAQTSADSLLALVNDILDFSKIEAGKVELEHVAFDLADTVEHPVKLLQSKAEQKGLRMGACLAPNVPARVVGDPGRLRQVLLNLLNNAVKFTKDGEVIVHGEVAEQHGTRVVLKFFVSDTGMGIPEDRLERLFKRFSQVDSSTTRVYGGTGLGLAICKQLVELSGGKIGVRSQVGGGTTFWFTLPLEIAPEETTPAREAADKSQKTAGIERSAARILLVEDNPVNQKVASKYLERAGYRCQIADSGEAAIAAVMREPFDLVLMDCQMPGMDGHEATHRIRELERQGKLPGNHGRLRIVALTASAVFGDRENCIRSGMDDFLSKPLDRGALLRVIEPLLSDCVAIGEHL